MDTYTIITQLNGLPRIFEAAQVTTFKCYRELDDGRIQESSVSTVRKPSTKTWVVSDAHDDVVCPSRGYVQDVLGVTLTGQFDNVLPTASRQTPPGTPVGLARALACSVRVSAYRAAADGYGQEGW